MGQIELKKIQDEAHAKQKKRTVLMGELLRSKGFFWLANSHDILGGWQQAGNVLRVEAEQHWMCLETGLWEGGANEELLDQCLLTEEEMALGPDKWKETMEDEESIVLELDDGASFNGDAGEEDDLEEEEYIEEEEEEVVEMNGNKDNKRKLNINANENKKKKTKA